MQEPIYAVENPFSIQLQPNQTYTITWDGVSYNLQYNKVEDVLGFIGNENYLNMQGGGNIPFAIILIVEAGTCFLSTESTAESHTISISTIQTSVHKLDSKYLDLPTNIATTEDIQSVIDVANTAQDAANTAQATADSKMDKTNPVGTGSFSMNRKSGTTVGVQSHAVGYNTTASGYYSHAEGWNSEATASSSHAEGENAIASGMSSHAEGHWTKAASKFQHAQGKFNKEDTKQTYAHIVGNGTSNTARSNAHTLDWNGVGWYQGGLQVGGTAQDDGAKNVLLEGDAIPVPTTAEVGQILSVKSVDESGKPTEWETMDAPAGGGSNQPLTFTGAVSATYDGSRAVEVEIPTGGGGGGDGLKLIEEFTLDEAVSTISKTFDKACKRIRIVFFDLSANIDGTVKYDFWFTINSSGYNPNKATKLTAAPRAESICGGLGLKKACGVIELAALDGFVRGTYQGMYTTDNHYGAFLSFKSAVVGESITGFTMHIGGQSIAAGLSMKIYGEA